MIAINSLVSIIIPVYNAEKYIKNTLESILNQTYKQLEIIIIDDGSTDNSYEICQNYLDDSRVSLYKQNNKGAPAARNKGINISTGDYILFFDADDILLKDSITKMVTLMNIENSELVIGNYSTFSNDKIVDKDTQKLNRIKGNKYNLYFTSPFPNNKLYLSSIIRNNKIYFDDVKIAQDANFFYKIIPHISNVSILDESVCLYRLTENSISRVYNDRILDIKKSMHFVEEYYKNNNISSKFYRYFSIAKLTHINIQLSKTVLFNDVNEGKKCYHILVDEYRKSLFSAYKFSLFFFKVILFRMMNNLKYYKRILLYRRRD